MSVQTEIDRIQKARNDLRTKGVALGIAVSTDNLTELATKYNGIADKGTPNAEVKEGESYTIAAGYYHGGVVKGVKGGGNYSLEKKTATPSKAEQSVEADSGYYGLSSVVVNAIPDAYQDVTSVTATADKVLAGSVFVDSTGKSTTGTMSNRGAVAQTLDTETTSYTIPQGYHSGAGTVSISTETKEVTPTERSQTVKPTSGKVLSSVTVESIPQIYGDATNTDANEESVLAGKVFITQTADIESLEYYAVERTGTMPNNGAVAPAALAAGGSYTIPAGYHNGSGKVTTKTLAAQTGVDSGKTAAAAAQILTGYQAWVNGAKITGTMANNGAVSGTITGLGSVTGDTYYTIPAGYHNGSGKVSITSDIETALAAI